MTTKVSTKSEKKTNPRSRRKSSKPTAPTERSRPVQLTFFDYAAAIGVALLPEAS